ncbi:MAG: LL-diaminopimelate aminotransferase [Candidatus Margulisbacteria bacterium]|nr:LL-diaminopimelate aminotransferase [Candidatus Margulisiibacteriota bacterium]MBU1021781.1 LL-diaminopimelate aminotransferase [Candidatus Margulisiibacteriota bacterium]MBU1729527.1 LL-diaminopimelate aminotransferase [Candidatus Margulisiibacteriota bacterium]MBU1955372.1 LL-diaminopimelate aminotransferase [Candidatus Margulisiibacteriota bacterium]
MKLAKRIENVPPYLFAQIDKKKAALKATGADIIDFGIGDPDLPTPEHINDVLHAALDDPKHQQYPPYEGTKEFRQAVATWYKKRFNVDLDPEKEVMALIGSKEGIAHVFFAFIDSGDIALIPDPAYPVYKVACILADGSPRFMPLTKEHGFLPKFEDIPRSVADKAKLMFLNYPNNPTGAVAGEKFLKQAVDFAKKHDILICQDFAYSEIAFDGYKLKSILEIPGAKDVAIEFHSLSKTYNVTGWRIGMVVGNSQAIAALSIIKTNVDSGAYKAIQHAAAAALTGPQDCIQETVKTFQERRDVLIEGLHSLGSKVAKPKATFYVWVKTPRGKTSSQFVEELMEKCAIITVPGSGYGKCGEGYIRMAITVKTPRIKEAIQRMKEAGIRF